MRIARELAVRGVDPELVAQTLDTVVDPDEEKERLQAALEKKARGRDLRDRKESGKVWQALVRQGFSPDAVSRAMRSRGSDGDEQE